MVKKNLILGGLTLCLVATAGTCVEAGLFGKEETPGERFRKALKEIESACAKKALAPNEKCGEVAKLKPADPLATEEGRFAHSIKIPNPVPTDSGYKPGMTPEEYFNHLCKTEAGEFIYKTVENVEGIFMMRPRTRATDGELEHLYALEDPYGHTKDESILVQDSYVQPATGKYQFLELPLAPARQSEKLDLPRYKRFYRDEKAHPGKKYQTSINGRGVFVPYVVAETQVSNLRSRYGYTWRGIVRPHDRRLGIAGGETIVLDLQTKEVLAVFRGYMQTGSPKNSLTGVWWLAGPSCPNRGTKLTRRFIEEVLNPLPLQGKVQKDVAY